MLIECYECKAQMSDAAAACPRCAAPRKTPHPPVQPTQVWDSAAPSSAPPPEEKSGLSWGWWVMGFVVLAGWGLAKLGNAPMSAETRDRYGIEECWKSQDRKDLDPGAARFVAGACYKMESDYAQKYGHKP
jgi:hypothetical protein